MKFLIRPEAPVLTRMPYGDVEYGFRKDSWGQIFFLAPHGRETIRFPCPRRRHNLTARRLRHLPRNGCGPRPSQGTWNLRDSVGEAMTSRLMPTMEPAICGHSSRALSFFRKFS